MIILPAIDIRDGKCVRLRQGDYNQETIFGDSPVEMAKKWVDEGAEYLHLVDLDGAKEGKPVNHGLVQEIVQTFSIPCQLGGGIRDEQAVSTLLDEAGLNRAIVGTQALKNPEWFRDMVEKYPGKMALGIDAKDSMVATEGWLDVSEKSVIDLANEYVGLDLGAVIYTNIANDGMMQGIDDGTIQDLIQLADMGLPVIASGGVTTLDDVIRLKKASNEHPNLIGAIIGRALYEGTISVKEAVEVARG